MTGAEYNQTVREIVLDRLEEAVQKAAEGTTVEIIVLAVQLEEDGGFSTASTFETEAFAMRVVAQCLGVYSMHHPVPGVTATITEPAASDLGTA